MGNGTMVLTQEYQHVQGTVTTGGKTEPVVMGKLLGNEIAFTAGGFAYKGLVSGNVIEGTVTTPMGDVPWRARR